MAFPTEISNLALGAESGGRCGPFVNSAGDVFIVGEDTGTADLEIWKATDPTASFALADTLLASGGNSYPKIGAISGMQLGSRLFILVQETTGSITPNRVSFIEYDVETETVISTETCHSPGGAANNASVDLCYWGGGESIQEQRFYLFYNGEAPGGVPTLLYSWGVTGAWTHAQSISADGQNPGASMRVRTDGDMLVLYGRPGSGTIGRYLQNEVTPTLGTERVVDASLGDGFTCGMDSVIRDTTEYFVHQGWDTSTGQVNLAFWCPVFAVSFGSDWTSPQDWDYFRITGTVTAADRHASLVADKYATQQPLYNATDNGAQDDLRVTQAFPASNGLNELVGSFPLGNHSDSDGSTANIFQRGNEIVFAWLTDDGATNILKYQEYVLRAAVTPIEVIESSAEVGNAAVTENYSFTATLQQNDVVIVSQYKDIGSYPQPTGYTVFIGPESNSPNTMVSWKRMGVSPDTGFSIGTGFGAGYAYTVLVLRNVRSDGSFLDVPVPSRTSGGSGSGTWYAPDLTTRGEGSLMGIFCGMDENGLYNMQYFPKDYENGVSSFTGGNPNGARAAQATKRLPSGAGWLENPGECQWQGPTWDANRGFSLLFRNNSFVGTYPTQVPLSAIPNQIKNIGPFYSSTGVTYAIGTYNGNTIKVSKSDESNVYFEEVDTWNMGNIGAIAVKQFGDILHVVQQSDQATIEGRVAYVQFDMVTDQFLISTQENPVFVPTSQPSTYGVDIDVRSDGDVILVYTGENTTSTQIQYSYLEGVTWVHGLVAYSGAAGEHGIAPTVLVGSNDIALFSWYVDTDAAADVRFRALSATNILRTSRTKTMSTQSRVRTGKRYFTRDATDWLAFGIEQNGQHEEHVFAEFTGDADYTPTSYVISTESVNNPLTTDALVADVTATGQPQYQVVNGSGANALKLALRSDDGITGGFGEIISDILQTVPGGISGLSAEIVEKAGDGVYLVYVYTDNGVLQYGEYLIRTFGETWTADNVALTVGGISLGGTGTVLPIWRVYADADTAIGSWTDDVGGTVNIFQAIDETPFNDADYIKSSDDPVADVCKVRLSNPGGLVDTANTHRLSYRFRKDGLPEIDLTVRLIQGASTVIATWVHTTLADTITPAVQTLTAPQIAAITDYDDLFLEFQADAQ